MKNECYFVCSRGLLKSCDFHSPNPMSSWCYDKEYLDKMLNENQMFDGMSIYICTDLILYFIDNILPHIPTTFYLVMGDSDATVPGGKIDIWFNNPKLIEEEVCLKIANHPKLIKWFAQNLLLIHEKVEQLPIGLDYHTIANDPNKPWRGENEGTMPIEQEIILNEVNKTAKPFYDRIPKIYVNFTVDLNNQDSERAKCLNKILNELICYDLGFKNRTMVWKKYTEYTFILSPCGNGPDCHRTWEALCLGCIPIVKSHGSNSMYKDLPVLILNEWTDVSEQLLIDTIEKFKNTQFNYDKLSLKYWINQFSNKRPYNVNPFELQILYKPYYDNDDLHNIQKLLEDKRKDVNKLIEDFYPHGDDNFKITLESIINRCSKGVVQKLIDTEKDIYPKKVLYKIGNGGNSKNCFVCCTPLSNDRAEKSKNIYQSLEKVGFNGYFYLFNGGFPCPTGQEMKYAAVPYCFKIFMMIEAKKMGFEKIIWLDASCFAINNPQKLFDILDVDDAIFRQFWPNTPGFLTYENTVYKETIRTINNITGGDLINSINVCTIVFGLNFARENIKKFAEEYFEMVKIGTPFLSYYPEEVVIAAIFNKPEFKYLFYNRAESHNLFINEHNVGYDYNCAKQYGYFFMQRMYK